MLKNYVRQASQIFEDTFVAVNSLIVGILFILILPIRLVNLGCLMIVDLFLGEDSNE